MSDVGAPGPGAAPAAPTPSQVPLPEAPRSPNPTSSTPAAKDGDTTTGQPPKGAERRSIDDSIKHAASKVEAKAEAKEKAEPRDKPEPKTTPRPEAKDAPAKSPPTRERGEGGRFASSEPAAASQEQPRPGQPDHNQAPTRFSPEAKAEWAAAPEKVRAETHRALKELEGGLYKYKEAAEAYHQVKDFDRLAKETGTTLPKALANYVTIERQLASDDPGEKWEGIQRVLKRAGVEPRQLAAAILNQPAPTPDQRDQEHQQAYGALQQEIGSLKQQLQQVAGFQQTQQHQAIEQRVTAFASKQPRFDELSAPDIEHSIQNLLKIPGMVPQGPPDMRLQRAYELADRLNPSAGGAAPSPQPRPANGAGTRSIAGSPANGSDPSLPAKKGKHSTIDESIRRAASRAGLS